MKVWQSSTNRYEEEIPLVYRNGKWVPSKTKIHNGSSWITHGASGEYIPNFSVPSEEFKYKWGYHLLTLESKKEAKLELYTRIYNMHLYNDTYKKYYVNKLNGSVSLISDYAIKISFYGYTNLSALKIYISDLGLTSTEVEHVKDAVDEDYPELLYKWCWNEAQYKSYISSSWIYIPYYPESTRQRLLKYCTDSFDKICKIIKNTYDIDYIEDNYWNNNKRYSRQQHAQCAKVIHDWIVTHSTYGDNSTAKGGDQEMWPALSEYVYDPVCASYARAFQYCCWRWGITCLNVNGAVIHSDRDGLHAWNLVTYEPLTILDAGINNPNIWAEVDLTWDDPSYNPPRKGYCRWQYFNCTSKWLYSTADGNARERSLYGKTGHGIELVASYPVDTSCNNTHYWYGYNSSLGYSDRYTFDGDSSPYMYTGFGVI